MDYTPIMKLASALDQLDRLRERNATIDEIDRQREIIRECEREAFAAGLNAEDDGNTRTYWLTT